MKITDGAKQLLENFLTKKGAEGIRISLLLGRLLRTQFTMNFSSPKETDKIETINGITMAFDSQVTGTEELTLDNRRNTVSFNWWQ